MIQRLKNIYRKLSPKALVLMYHRVTSLHTDPWQLAVEPERFEQQLQVIKQMGSVISSDTLVNNLQSKRVKNFSLVVTFDDGYYDNFSNALPLLEKYAVPATFFITTNQLGKASEFWWDALENIIIHSPVLPQLFSVFMHGIQINYDLQEEAVLQPQKKEEMRKWLALAGFQNRRTILYEMLWKGLKPLKHEQQQQVLLYLKAWAGNNIADRIENRAMTENELSLMANHPLITIGGHTTTHPDLSCHGTEFQQQEIITNKKRLEQITGKTVNLFAYPYGGYNNDTPQIVANSGYKAAFTTSNQLVRGRSHPYLLSRLQVNNWTGDEFYSILNRYFQTAFQ